VGDNCTSQVPQIALTHLLVLIVSPCNLRNRVTNPIETN